MRVGHVVLAEQRHVGFGLGELPGVVEVDGDVTGLDCLCPFLR